MPQPDIVTTLGPFEALVFDQDGTLLDAEALHCAAWCHVAARLGLPFDSATFADFAGRGDLAIAEHLAGGPHARGGQAPAALVEHKRDHYKAHLDTLELMPGVITFLERAQQRGFKLAMATISPAEETLRVVERLGLDRYLTEVVHRESMVPGRPGERVRSKPEPDIYLAAAARLAVDPQRCCAFEDSLTGLRAARAAQMTVIAIPTRYSRHFDFSAADELAGSFEALDVDAERNVLVTRQRDDRGGPGCH